MTLPPTDRGAAGESEQQTCSQLQTLRQHRVHERSPALLAYSFYSRFSPRKTSRRSGSRRAARALKDLDGYFPSTQPESREAWAKRADLNADAAPNRATAFGRSHGTR